MLLYFFPLRITVGTFGGEHQTVAKVVALAVVEIYRHFVIHKHLNVSQKVVDGGVPFFCQLVVEGFLGYVRLLKLEFLFPPIAKIDLSVLFIVLLYYLVIVLFSKNGRSMVDYSFFFECKGNMFV